MGYRSHVKILMGMKAFEVLKSRCEASENEYTQEMVQKPSSLIINNDEQSVLIGWEWYEWYSGYEEIGAVEDTLDDLTAWVEADEKKYPLEDYYYKRILIGEDDAVEERTNDPWGDYTSDFYTEVKFSL